MKIAIVGLGWLGSPLAKYFKNQQFKVVGSTTRTEKKLELEKDLNEVCLLDINYPLNTELLHSFFAEIDVLVLCIPPSKSIFNTYANQCVDVCKLIPTKAKVIFTSSTSVYKDHVSDAREDSNVLSNYEYTGTLFQTEKALRILLNERLTILRLAGLIGPNRSLAKFFAGKKALSNGLGKVNLVHLDDCIGVINQVITQNCWGETINVCASSHPSRIDFYTEWCQQLKLALPDFIDEESTQKIVSNEKSKTLLDYSYKYDDLMQYLKLISENNPSL